MRCLQTTAVLPPQLLGGGWSCVLRGVGRAERAEEQQQEPLGRARDREEMVSLSVPQFPHCELQIMTRAGLCEAKGKSEHPVGLAWGEPVKPSAGFFFRVLSAGTGKQACAAPWFPWGCGRCAFQVPVGEFALLGRRRLGLSLRKMQDC